MENLIIENMNDQSIREKISVWIANYFPIKDIEYICQDLLAMDTVSIHDINTEELLLYRYETLKGIEIIIKDIIHINSYPPMRYIEISINADIYHIYKNIKLSYTTNFYNVINIIVTEAYNYSVYCKDSLTEESVDRTKLFTNYINEIFELLGFNSIMFNNFLLTLNKDLSNKILLSNKKFLKIYKLYRNSHVELGALTNKIFRLTIVDTNNSNKKSIYLTRDFTGLGNLQLIIDRLVAKIKCP